MSKFTIEKKVGATVRFIDHFWVIRDEAGHRLYLGFNETAARSYFAKLISDARRKKPKRKPQKPKRKSRKPKTKKRR